MTGSGFRAVNVYARWRPLTDTEKADGEIHRQTTKEKETRYSVTIDRASSKLDRPWKSPASFTTVFEPNEDNEAVFAAAVKPAIPKVLQGASCNFFAYGHTGSGKTHTIIGYNYEDKSQLGVCLTAANGLFEALSALNAGDERLGVGLRVYEMRKDRAFDLLNNHTPCHIRQGADGRTHIRGPTEMLEGGKVRVRPIMQHACWTFEELRETLRETLRSRSVGTSSVHDLSSRTHVVMEMEIVTEALIAARERLIDRESELVPVGKRVTDIKISESYKSLMKGPDGGWVMNPDCPINQAVVDAADKELAEYESRVRVAEQEVQDVFTAANTPVAVGGKVVFVDLAGSEYHQEKGSKPQPFLAKQTPQERQEGRQINTDLLALKEVIRAIAANQSRIPFRSSPLTMALREHFLGSKEGSSAMIVTASPAKDQYPATLNSLKYAGLLGIAVA